MHPRDALTTAPILPALWRLSLPNMVAMVGTALVSIAETLYIGRLGTLALAGIALVFPLVMLQQMLSAGSVGGGISSAVSRAFGAGQEAKARALALHAAWLSAALGLLFGAALLLGGRALFALMGGAGATLETALAYADVAFAGSVFIWLTNGLASVLRGAGDMRTPSRVLIGVALLQVVLGGLLGLGWGPVPRLGMAGVAWGQVLAFGAGALVLYRHLRRADCRVRLQGAGRLQWALLRDILRVGAIASISSLQTVLTILILTRIVARYGPQALAGYGIGARLEFLLIPITFAIGVACVPMVGMALGAGRVQRARRVAWIAASLAAAIVGTLGLAVALVPTAWSALFTADAAVLGYANSYFRWAGPCYGFFAFGLCLYFASQGAGRLLGPVLAGTFRLLLVLLGGWFLVAQGAPAFHMFALIGAAMLAYGVLSGLAVYRVRWGA